MFQQTLDFTYADVLLNALRPSAHTYIVNLTIIDSDNGLSPRRRQATIWTNERILLIWIIVNKIQWTINQSSYIFILENAFENVVCEMASICLGLNVLTYYHEPEKIDF